MNSLRENVTDQQWETSSPGGNNDEEALSNSQVYSSIYNGVVTSDKDKCIKLSKEWQDWNTKTIHVQEWYIRCSWINKFLFLEALCKATTGCLVIGNVLKCTESIIAKDVVESLSGVYAEFSMDRIPNDDNRSLPSRDLTKTMKEDFIWFVKLEPSRQVSVILRLLRLGGSNLIFSIHNSIANLYKERQIEYGRLSMVSIAQSILKANEDHKFKNESRPKLAKKSMSSISRQNTDRETDDSESSKRNSPTEFTNKKLEALTRRENEISEYKRSRGIANGGETSKTSKKAGGETGEIIDYLQILPIYLNRRIMSHVDEKTLSGLKKVGKYWVKMIDESINEKSGRRAINAKINKIIGMKPERRREKCRESNTKRDDEEKNYERQGNDDDDELAEAEKSEKKDFFKRNNLSEKDLLNADQLFERIFSKKFQVIKLDKSTFYDRCCCFDEKINVIACSTPSNVIYFHSLRTGAKLNFSVFGFDSAITCLTLHPNSIYVFVGCKDGTLVSKALRTNKKNAQFYGHNGSIKSLHATTSHLLSLSSENNVRYHQLWSGICLLCIDISQEYTVSRLLLTKDFHSPRCAIGTKEGFLVLVDVDNKKYTRKVKVHNGEIIAMAQAGTILITAEEGGKIRVWDLTQLETNLTTLTPYCDIHVATCISSLYFHRNQMVVGCQNGTVKIISLGNGKTIKTFKVAGQVPVLGSALSQDRFTLKVILWHDEGIEMRIFSLVKLPRRSSSSSSSSSSSTPNGKSIKKNNRKCKQRPSHEAKKIKFSELVSTKPALVVGGGGDCGGGGGGDDTDQNVREVIELMPNT